VSCQLRVRHPNYSLGTQAQERSPSVSEAPQPELCSHAIKQAGSRDPERQHQITTQKRDERTQNLGCLHGLTAVVNTGATRKPMKRTQDWVDGMHQLASRSGAQSTRDRTNPCCIHELGREPSGRGRPSAREAGVEGHPAELLRPSDSWGSRGWSGKVRQRWMQPLRIYLTSAVHAGAVHRNRVDWQSTRLSHPTSKIQGA
jgi:hypothetical protein